ncbi:MAG: hypothetical protein FJ388_08720, partial [Verrucomicrobia bacterium]|nr:hypothetical protein [Verrucomicrobiota bacterium]
MKHGVQRKLCAPEAKSNFLSLVVPFVVAFAISICAPAQAAEQPKPAAAPSEPVEETKARAAYDAAEKAAREAEAAVGPLRATMQKADTAYAEAKKVADAKRQQATEAKRLSGESGVTELKQAEDGLVAGIRALNDATNAKPPLDKALDEARAAAAPLQQAYDAAEKVAKEAEIPAKAAAD